MDALKLLDSDCWRLVFRKLDADDLMSCRQVCKPFRRLLDDCEFQVKWKFQLVLPHLVPYLKLIIPPDKNYLVRMTSINRGVSWKDLYKLRLVCKSWHQSVDNYAEEYKPALFPGNMRNLPLVTCFKNSEDIEEFQEKFGESERNPFPLKTVYIHHHSPFNPDLRYPDHLLKTEIYIRDLIDLDFVELFGRNISKLELDINQHFTLGPLPLCKLLKKISLHMKNLKTFIIGTGKNPFSNEDVERERETPTWIEENALEELPKLTALKIDGLDEVVEDYLLKWYAPQLTDFEGVSPSHKSIKDHHVILSRSLEAFQIRLVNPETRLRVLRFLNSLKSLKLIAVPYHHTDRFLNFWKRWNIDEVLQNLKHLQLEQLEVTLYSKLDLTEAELKLEDYTNQSIRTLCIQFYNSFGSKNSFNFLEALTKLEKLELNFGSPLKRETTFNEADYPIAVAEAIKRIRGRETLKATVHPEDLPEVVRLNEYLAGEEEMDKMYQSNVWEKVPTLKTLTVEWQRKNYVGWRDKYAKSVYTRKKYERVRKSSK